MGLYIQSDFQQTCRNCFNNISKIYQNMYSEISQWNDAVGQRMKKDADKRKGLFQGVVNEAVNVLTALREVEMASEIVDSETKKETKAWDYLE